ncbi:hypothetical protein FGO68_gene17643 [Halteria grandinella]|uniref:Ankyrin repeat domain-containing protein n=1 Tax=Halteria grandinella TaxID=5974 RepID=A0A8J8SWG7_HALGN|nr:hypothetical protein FGO68_gene17643 [Halteria grandinella]
MKEYCERGGGKPSVTGGQDINCKDFADWTPLHCAAYLGQTTFLRYLLHRQGIFLNELNDEGKTPILLAIEAGNVFSEDNVCISLLERGAKLDDEIWHKLLILSLNYDIVTYPTLAFRHGINIHNVKDETKISFHKAVCCLAVKIMKLYTETYSHLELVKMLNEQDFQGVNAIDYAKLTERPEIIDMVEKIRMGIKIEVPNFGAGQEEEEHIQITSAQLQNLKQMQDGGGSAQVKLPGEDKVHHNEDHWRKRTYEAEEQWPAGAKPTFVEFKSRLEEEHFQHLKEAHMRIREKDSQVYSLRDQITTQADQMAKLQSEIDKLIMATKYDKEQANQYFQREQEQAKLSKAGINKQVTALNTNMDATNRNIDKIKLQQIKEADDYQQAQLQNHIRAKNENVVQQQNTLQKGIGKQGDPNNIVQGRPQMQRTPGVPMPSQDKIKQALLEHDRRSKEGGEEGKKACLIF